MNALLGTAVRWAHARGVRRFSLGESHGRAGLARFKQGWGPAGEHNTVIVRVYRPAMARLWRALEPTARRVYAAWDAIAAGESRPRRAARLPRTRSRSARPRRRCSRCIASKDWER